MKNGNKSFAFKLAEKKQAKVSLKDGKWVARDGVAIAGCTDLAGNGMYRESVDYSGRPTATDKGYWC